MYMLQRSVDISFGKSWLPLPRHFPTTAVQAFISRLGLKESSPLPALFSYSRPLHLSSPCGQLHPAWPLHAHARALVNGSSRAWGGPHFPLSFQILPPPLFFFLTVPSRFTLPWGTCKVLEPQSRGFEPSLCCRQLWDLGLKCTPL